MGPTLSTTLAPRIQQQLQQQSDEETNRILRGAIGEDEQVLDDVTACCPDGEKSVDSKFDGESINETCNGLRIG